MDYIYPVIVNREGDSGADALIVGIYADEFTARRVAKDHKLHDDEWITTGPWPVLREAVEMGAPGVDEGSVTYQRNGWD